MESYECVRCHYNTNKKSSWKKHLTTSKHTTYENELIIMDIPKAKMVRCPCGNEYKHASSLWNHKKVCPVANAAVAKITTTTTTETDDVVVAKEEDTNMIKQIIKQNQHLILENKEFKQMLMELALKPTTINNNNHNTTHNKQFNLQVYLNETCKNAMNLSEFVDSLVIKASELEDMGRLGYAQGISNIIIRGLNELDETQRPFHCTDKKRETIYIKENNVWEKETAGRLLLRKMIRDIAHRNFKRMPQWMLDNPSCDDTSTKKHVEYMYIVNQVMTGLGPDDDIGINKIIHTVANYIYLDKGAIMGL